MAELGNIGQRAGLSGAGWVPAQMHGRNNPLAQILVTEDGGTSMALLFAQGGESTAVMIQHPREFIVGHYLIPALLDAGVAVLAQAPRSIGNDLRLEHEKSLLEVAAGVRFLRKQGFEKIVLLGNSGGAALYSYYNEQALTKPKDRLQRSPTGRPTKFEEADLPGVDGLIFVSPHPGQGLLLMNSVDPSVADEADARSIIEELNPFSPANGFALPPEGASYSEAFVERYRAAQRDRVARIDTWAREVIAQRMDARKKMKAGGGFDAMIDAFHTPIRTIWRTDADLRCWDISLDPSERKFGSLWGGNPIVSNYGSVGFGRLVTAESWLSTWSGLSSMASMLRTAPAIEQPTLMLIYKSDNSVFPSEASAIFEAVGASDKDFYAFSGDHHGRVGSEREGQQAAGECIATWLSEKGFR